MTEKFPKMMNRKLQIQEIQLQQDKHEEEFPWRCTVTKTLQMKDKMDSTSIEYRKSRKRLFTLKRTKIELTVDFLSTDDSTVTLNC